MPSTGQVQRMKRELRENRVPDLPIMTKLQAAIERASQDRPDLTTFIGRLQSLDVGVRAYISDKGRKRISYKLEGLAVRGSKLHNGSFPKLISERGISFNPDRDRAAMDDAAKGIKVNLSESESVQWNDIDLLEYLPQSLKARLKSVSPPQNSPNKSKKTPTKNDLEL